MTELVVVPPGGGEIVGDSPERRVEILSDDESLHATWSRFGPGRDGADLHVHRRHTDLFYVLAGELTVRLGVEDEPVVVPARMLARVPPLVVHGFRNGSDGELRYLNFHAPGQRFADYLRAMRDRRAFSYDQHDPPEDGGRPVTDAVVGGGEIVEERPDLRVTLLADVEEIAIAETWSGGARELSPPHVHRRHVESVAVLEGELTFTLAGGELRAAEGSWVQIPAGVPHAVSHREDRPARFLEIHTPGSGYGAFLRGGGEPAAFDQAPA